MSSVDNHLIEMHFEKMLKKEEEIQNTANIKKKDEDSTRKWKKKEQRYTYIGKE